MKTVIQNTEEWHKLRETRIGASEANIIMGVSEYSTPVKLWEIKRNPGGPRKENNFIQAKGHRTEPRLRAYLEMLRGSDFPDEVALSEQYDFLMASLDGVSHELRELGEFKLVGQEDFELVKSGKPLPQYYPQMQAQLLVTGYDRNWLVVGADDLEEIENGQKGALKIHVLEVLPDLDYIGGQLFPALNHFWDCVKSGKKPPLTSADVLELNNADLDAMLTRYQLMVQEQEELEKTVEKLKADIFKLTTKHHSKVICQGVKVYEIQEKDGVKIDFKQFVEDQELDIPSKYKTVTKGRKMRKITFPKAEARTAEEMIVQGAEIPAEKPKKRSRKPA